MTGIELRAVITVTPDQRIFNSDFLDTFDEEFVGSASKVVGVEQRFLASNVSFNEMAATGVTRLVEKLSLDKAKIDAVIVVTQTGDIRMPANAYEIARLTNLHSISIAYDFNHGCSGYPLALQQARALMISGTIKNCIVIAGEIPSRIVDPNDRSTALVFGDAVSVSWLETSNFDSFQQELFINGTDVEGVDALQVNDNGFGEKGTYKSSENQSGKYLKMNGHDVFLMTQKIIPNLLKEIEARSATEIDFYLLHQANRLMLDHLIKKSKINKCKFPINIQKYGNTSSASIPLLLTDQAVVSIDKATTFAFVGFGVGFSWSACVVKLSPLSYLSHMEYSNGK